jgi:hypothetical protein
MSSKGLLSMGDVVNLNKARKAKAAVDKAARADANRAKFGRTKAQKQAEAEDAYRRTKLLDDSKLD